ncbi:SigB/SigF/SigG family RNA polymerase sigma factor [Kitasatospora sp. RB6PN24]|uniref:SigB/SigF/SigG family RNA polymerase sigma factor n=1 Tax=Kitasatospora humi TaxID=2893891 RepID=UPI001E609D2D|nr:SigB/SigF/SigG family RNA polymerase sigma factor [Kitasatospora humi]MCC9307907.1 SigB/SigF/SigG family RNA polymerase sigma factor [Kitasatospora humi]
MSTMPASASADAETTVTRPATTPVPPRPSQARLRAMGKDEARELSDALFARLTGLERESAAYSYVRGTIIELNMPLVRFVAGRFRHRSEEMQDLVQIGTVGLIKAVDGYDPGRGVEFVTYAIPTISGEIKRYFRDTSWPVRVPRSVQELYLTVVRGSDRLEQQLGRVPRPEEIADDLDLAEEQVAEGQAAGRVCRTDSLDALHDEQDPAGSSLLDRMGERDAELDLVEFREAVRPLLAALPYRERFILVLRFWDDLTQSQIAARVGISQMHVSRLLTATLKELRERLDSD